MYVSDNTLLDIVNDLGLEFKGFSNHKNDIVKEKFKDNLGITLNSLENYLTDFHKKIFKSHSKNKNNLFKENLSKAITYLGFDEITVYAYSNCHSFYKKFENIKGKLYVEFYSSDGVKVCRFNIPKNHNIYNDYMYFSRDDLFILLYTKLLKFI